MDGTREIGYRKNKVVTTYANLAELGKALGAEGKSLTEDVFTSFSIVTTLRRVQTPRKIKWVTTSETRTVTMVLEE